MNDVRVKLDLQAGFRTQIKAGAHTLIADEPIKAGGTDEGMSPYELLLSALGACTAMTLKMYIERKQLPITEVEVLLSFDRIHKDDCDSCTEEETLGKQEIQHISRLIYVKGEVTAEQKARLHGDPHVEDALIVRPA
jgi:uncharacterized OsmC-like protein